LRSGQARLALGEDDDGAGNPEVLPLGELLDGGDADLLTAKRARVQRADQREMDTPLRHCTMKEIAKGWQNELDSGIFTQR
jgi:hypothetical protein